MFNERLMTIVPIMI